MGRDQCDAAVFVAPGASYLPDGSVGTVRPPMTGRESSISG